MALYGRDHRHFQLLPDPADLLAEVGDATGGQVADAAAVTADRGPTTTDHLLEGAEVEPDAERCAVARQHDRAQPRLGLQRLPGGGDRLEHRQIERVSLVRSIATEV